MTMSAEICEYLLGGVGSEYLAPVAAAALKDSGGALAAGISVEMYTGVSKSRSAGQSAGAPRWLLCEIGSGGLLLLIAGDRRVLVHLTQASFKRFFSFKCWRASFKRFLDFPWNLTLLWLSFTRPPIKIWTVSVKEKYNCDKNTPPLNPLATAIIR